MRAATCVGLFKPINPSDDCLRFTHRCSLDHNEFSTTLPLREKDGHPSHSSLSTVYKSLCIRLVFAHPLAFFSLFTDFISLLYAPRIHMGTGLLATTCTQVQPHYSIFRFTHTSHPVSLSIHFQQCSFIVCLFNAFELLCFACMCLLPLAGCLL